MVCQALRSDELVACGHDVHWRECQGPLDVVRFVMHQNPLFGLDTLGE
jgi:hypothetical protein